MFSRRTGWSLEKNPLISFLDDLKKQNHKILDLTESNPTKCNLFYPKGQILKAFDTSDNIIYQPSSFGGLGARNALVTSYQESGFLVSSEKIVLTSSTSEAYAFLFRLLLNPKEHILLPSPSYPLFEFLANLNDVEIDFYPLSYNKIWQIDIASLERMICSETKAIVLVNPNNPTGSFVKKSEIEAINRICKQHHLAIICDEVFSDYLLQMNEENVRSLCENNDVLTFVLGGLSKSLGMPQMKLSWILASGPKEQTQEALNRLEIIADTYLSVNTPSQNALQEWLFLKEEIQGNIKKRLIQNKNTIQRIFQPYHNFCEVLDLEGGWYIVLHLNRKIEEESFALNLLKDKNVFVHPGYFFDFNEEPYLVVSLLTDPKALELGAQKILESLCSQLA